MVSGNRILVWLMRVLLLCMLVGGGTGLLSNPAFAQDPQGKEQDGGWCGIHGNYTGPRHHCGEGSGSSSSGSSSGGPSLSSSDFKNYSTTQQVLIGTVWTVPVLILASPLFLTLDVLNIGRGFPLMSDMFKTMGLYFKAWGTVFAPVATGIWVGGKFIVYDAPVAAGEWVGPRLWTGVSHVFYIWPVAAGAWIGNGFRSRNVPLESAYARLDRGDNLEASRLFREELRKDRADAAARRGLGKATNALRNEAESKAASLPQKAPLVFLSSSGAGAGLVSPPAAGAPATTGVAAQGAAPGCTMPVNPGGVAAGATGPTTPGAPAAGQPAPGVPGTAGQPASSAPATPGGTPSGNPVGQPGGPGNAAVPGALTAFSQDVANPIPAGYERKPSGSETAPGKHLKSAQSTSLQAQGSSSIEDSRRRAAMTFDNAGVNSGDLNPIVKVGRSGPPVEYRVPAGMENEPAVLKLSTCKDQEKARRVEATAAAARLEEETSRNPGPDRLAMLRFEKKQADLALEYMEKTRLLQETVVEEVAFRKFGAGANKSPDPVVTPAPGPGK